MVNSYQKCFYNFFVYEYKMVHKYYQKTKKSPAKKHVEGTKILLKKKNKKGKKRIETDLKIPLKKEKRKSVSIIVIEIKVFLKRKNERKSNS